MSNIFRGNSPGSLEAEEITTLEQEEKMDKYKGEDKSSVFKKEKGTSTFPLFKETLAAWIKNACNFT